MPSDTSTFSIPQPRIKPSTTPTTNMSNQSSSSYEPSTYSQSTTDSFTKEPVAQPPKSFRQKVKEVFQDVGYPPTRRYDMENGQQKKTESGMMGSGPFVNNRPQRS